MSAIFSRFARALFVLIFRQDLIRTQKGCRGSLADVFGFLAIFSTCALVSLTLWHGLARSQETAATQPLLNLGDAVVTGFSGVLDSKEVKPLFIDPDGAALRGFDLSNPGAKGPLGQPLAPEFLSVTAREIGQVFGIALDDATDPSTQLPAPNIYATATSAYGLTIVGLDKDGDGAPDRLTSGGADAKWMEGLFGLRKGGGPGSIWKIDGLTGEASLLANITHDGQPNPGAALGNIAFDAKNRQLFVSDRDTGLIHRFDMDGNERDTFDHGATGRGIAGLEPVTLETGNRADITKNTFKTTDPTTWGLADPKRRVWGLAVHEGRLYYAVADGPQIWSVNLGSDGGFDIHSARRELDISDEAGPGEVADIAFTPDGQIILAQRPPVKGAADFGKLVAAEQAAVLHYQRDQPGKLGVEGLWARVPGEYPVGFEDERRSAAGGVALGYGYSQTGGIDRNTCSAMVWATGDALRKSLLKAAGLTDGIQGLETGRFRGSGEPPPARFIIDYDGQYPQTKESGHVGDIEIAHRCAVEVVAEPAPAVPGVAPPPGPGVAPPAPLLADLAIDKEMLGDCVQGFDCQFAIIVTNRGPATYQGPLLISDTMSVPGVTFKRASGGAWNCQQAGGQINCSRPTLLLRPGRWTVLDVWLNYTGNPNIGSWQNCAMLTWLGQGPGSADTVRAVQAELTGLGFYNGAIDGVAGSGTRKAIRDLEKAYGLPETGKITPTLLDWLFGPGASVAADPNGSNDRDCVTIPTQPVPPAISNADLAIEKTALSPKCYANKTCKFKITLTNKGPGPYKGGLKFTDKMPNGWSYAGVQPSGWQCQSINPGKFTCDLPVPLIWPPITTLKVGESKDVTLELKVPSNQKQGEVKNCVIFDVAKGKANPEDCATTEIAASHAKPKFTISKTGPAQCNPGQKCTYKITMKSGSGGSFGDARMLDQLPSGWKMTRWSLGLSPGRPPPTKNGNKQDCKQNGDLVDCGLFSGTWPANETYIWLIDVMPPANQPPRTVKNCAEINFRKHGRIARSCVVINGTNGWDLYPAYQDVDMPKKCNRASLCAFGVEITNAHNSPNDYKGKIGFRLDATAEPLNSPGTYIGLEYTRQDWDCDKKQLSANNNALSCRRKPTTLSPAQWTHSMGYRVLVSKLPDTVTKMRICATALYDGKPDDDASNDTTCAIVKLETGKKSSSVGFSATGTPVCTPPNCSFYQFTASSRNAPYSGPLSLKIIPPPGASFSAPRFTTSTASCPASGWSCSRSGAEFGGVINCRISKCALKPGEKVTVRVEGNVAADLKEPPEKEQTREVCGEMEFRPASRTGGIEQNVGAVKKRACVTTRILARAKLPKPITCPRDEGWKPYPEGTALLPGWKLKKFGTGANAIFCMKREVPSDLQLSSAPQGRCMIGQTCLVGTSVTNVGKKNFAGRIEWQGQVKPLVSIRAIKPVQRGWTCRTTGGGRYICVGEPGKFAPGASTQFQLALAIPRNFRHKQLTHSVRLVWPQGKGDANPANDSALFTIPIGAVIPPPPPPPPVVPEVDTPKPPKAGPTPPPSCTGGKVRVGKRCVCPRGTREVRGRCIRPKPAPPKPIVCTGGKVRVGKRCVCPRGTNDILGLCIPAKTAPPPPPPPSPPPSCTSGKVRVGNRCVCPPGTREMRGTCVRPPPPPPPPPPAAPKQGTIIEVLPMKPVCPAGQYWNTYAKPPRCSPIPR